MASGLYGRCLVCGASHATIYLRPLPLGYPVMRCRRCKHHADDWLAPEPGGWKWMVKHKQGYVDRAGRFHLGQPSETPKARWNRRYRAGLTKEDRKREYQERKAKNREERPPTRDIWPDA